jgi:hypothetical protein
VRKPTAIKIVDNLQSTDKQASTASRLVSDSCFLHL